MRQTEVLIMVIALLARRPDAMDIFLPAPERLKISQIYAGTPTGQPFRLPAMKGEKA